jgi:hypothetical protein
MARIITRMQSSGSRRDNNPGRNGWAILLGDTIKRERKLLWTSPSEMSESVSAAARSLAPGKMACVMSATPNYGESSERIGSFQVSCARNDVVPSVRMWYPHFAQWWVLWVVVIIVCFGLIAAYDIMGIVPSAVIIGALLVWRLSRRK